MIDQIINGMTSFQFFSMGEECHARHLIVNNDAPILIVATGGSSRGSLSPSWVDLPHIYYQNGISTVIFDFAGQGHSKGDRKVLTIKKGVQNLTDLLDHLLKWEWVSLKKIALMGSSYGGNVVLDYLSSNTSHSVRGAVFKSPCIDLGESYFQELGEEGMKRWEEEGFLESTGLNWEVIREANESDLENRLHKIKVPLLITHGTTDESVPIDQSRKVRDSIDGVVDLVEMKGTNHHYSERDDWERMISLHVGWLKNQFFNVKGIKNEK